MEKRNPDNTIFYQERVHHRQKLRNEIDPRIIDKLQINQNPSAVSRKAYKSLYQDQLEREVQEHNRNIQNQRSQLNSISIPLNKDGRASHVFRNAGEANQGNKNFQGFQDYDKEKGFKVQTHINNNYDGGVGFFRASEQWDRMQKTRYQEMRETLQKQAIQKKYEEFQKNNLKNIENRCFQEKLDNDKVFKNRQKSVQKEMKTNYRQENLRYIEQERTRKQRKSLFQYNNHGIRHNPITNPIEYHIDNPYILKRIQQKSQKLRIL